MIKLIFKIIITVLIIYDTQFIIKLYIWISFEKRNVTLLLTVESQQEGGVKFYGLDHWTFLKIVLNHRKPLT